jgi:hypothetical protein
MPVIDFAQLFDPRENAVEFGHHGLKLGIGDLETGERGDFRHVGGGYGHALDLSRTNEGADRTNGPPDTTIAARITARGHHQAADERLWEDHGPLNPSAVPERSGMGHFGRSRAIGTCRRSARTSTGTAHLHFHLAHHAR